MLIPVHHVPERSCKAKGRLMAAVVAQAVVDADMRLLAEEFWILHCGYAATWRRGRRVFMHHAVIGRQPGLDVSHENANKLDNRRENLRHVDRSVNMLNPADGPSKANQSCGIRGVTRDDCSRPLARPWRGKVTVRGETHQTARFARAQDAALALARLRLKLRVREFPEGRAD